MMSSLSSCVLDQDVCDTCKHLFIKKDKIIDDLKRNLQSRENQVEDLEHEVKKLQEDITLGMLVFHITILLVTFDVYEILYPRVCNLKLHHIAIKFVHASP